ncbi:MAG: succinyl-diaminopimelate desuccinylase [Bifidobacteriaceae bacterium]|nr:succinyl-diaminopimelate desuccinylase [Bifidobacteriaceae bacterium]
MTLDLGLPPAELALRLVDIPSPSGHETALADAVAAALEQVEHLEVLRDADAVVARTNLAGRGGGARTLVAGHLDTVPIVGNVPGRIDGGQLIGRGSVDMKGGLAAMLHTAALPPAGDVTWVFYDHEEVAYAASGLGRLIRNHPEWLAASFGILCEPTGAALECGCNGTIRVRLMAHGQAAHSARPWTGLNAVHRLAPALNWLAAYEGDVVRLDGLDYRESISAVGVAGGAGGNVIPDYADLLVNYRFAPNKTQAQAIDRLRNLFDGYELRVEDSAPAAPPALDHPQARRLAGIVTAHGGGQPKAKQGWTDVARLAERGIPAVNLGPGNPEMAHQDAEACPLEQIDQVAAILAEYLVA